ncbi:MAG: HEAT repeat domain-containing protein, partial [Gemmataceae bacterium]
MPLDLHHPYRGSRSHKGRLVCLTMLALLMPACARDETPPPEVTQKTDNEQDRSRKPTDAEEQTRSLPDLIKDVQSGDKQVRESAIRAIGELGPKAEEAIPALIEAMKKRDNVGLGTMVKGRDDGYAPNSTRESAVWALLQIGPKGKEALARSGLTILLEGLKDKDPSVRDHTLTALGQLGPLAKPAIPEMVRCLADPSTSVSHSAQFALQSVGPEAAPAVLACLKSDDAKVRRAAGRTIRWMRDLPVEPLIEALRSDDPYVRYSAAQALFSLGPQAKPAAAELIKRLSDRELVKAADQHYAEYTVVDTLAAIGVGAVPELTSALQSDELAVRSGAARALGKIGPPAKSAAPALIKLLDDKFVGVSLEAACALVRVGGDPDRPMKLLGELLKHEVTAVRWHAADACRRIGSKAAPAIPALIQALKDSEAAVRRQAAQALEVQGEAARAAVPELTRLLEDDEFVRRDAARALEAIGPGEDSVAALVKAFHRDLGQIYPNPAGESLKKLGSRAKSAVPELTAILKQTKDFDAVGVMEVLAAIGPEAASAVPTLIEVLSTPTEDPGPKGKPVGPRLRSEAIRTLAKIGPAAAPAVPKLIEMMSQDNNRAEIAHTLGAIGPEAKVAVPKLLPLLTDKDAEVRAWSAAALIRLTGKTDEYLPVLLTIVREKSDSNRERWGRSRAVAALVWLGPDIT